MFKVHPKHTDTRIVSRFLFFPKTLGGITQRWCRATWQQVCLHVYDEPHWFDFAWTYPHGVTMPPAEGYSYRLNAYGWKGIPPHYIERHGSEYVVCEESSQPVPSPAAPPPKRKR
jgi:hypothetical protein